ARLFQPAAADLLREPASGREIPARCPADALASLPARQVNRQTCRPLHYSFVAASRESAGAWLCRSMSCAVGRSFASQPPPSALTSATLSLRRLPRMLIALRSLLNAVVCAVITLR